MAGRRPVVRELQLRAAVPGPSLLQEPVRFRALPLPMGDPFRGRRLWRGPPRRSQRLHRRRRATDDDRGRLDRGHLHRRRRRARPAPRPGGHPYRQGGRPLGDSRRVRDALAGDPLPAHRVCRRGQGQVHAHRGHSRSPGRGDQERRRRGALRKLAQPDPRPSQVISTGSTSFEDQGLRLENAGIHATYSRFSWGGP